MLNLLDPHSLLATLGAAGVFVILFAETGLLIGFFLPGDSLLFTAGLFIALVVALSLTPLAWEILRSHRSPARRSRGRAT